MNVIKSKAQSDWKMANEAQIEPLNELLGSMILSTDHSSLQSISA
jgi:hypothetical protein